MYATATGIARHKRSRNTGMASVLAMLYLVLFGGLALGFYASVAASAQVAANDQRGDLARLAAESGAEFFRYQLRYVILPAATPDNKVLATIADQLTTAMEGTSNMATMTVGYTDDTTGISVPSVKSQFITLDDSGSGFRADITRPNGVLTVKITGRDATGKVFRAIRLNYQLIEEVGTVFNYGMATKGAVSLSGGILKGVPDSTRGSFFSSTTATNTPLTMSGSAVISDQVYFTNPNGAVSGSGSINGTTVTAQWPAYIHKGVAAPEFPTIDPTPFINYLNTHSPTVISASTSATPLSNIRIKAGTNPSFSGGGTIYGVILIEAPNKVTFSGGTNFKGVIVTDNPTESTSTNMITFSGGGNLQGPETLDPAVYGDLTKMTGAAILAPNFGLTLTGGSATFGGSVMVKSVSLSGGSGGAVNGTVISYGTASTTFSGGSGFTFTQTGATKIPQYGVHFQGHFCPVATSYQEVSP